MMVDCVILTVSINDKELDMEFPVSVPISDLKPIFSNALKKKGIYVNNIFSFVYDGKTLPDSESFGSLGIWDGSYIRVY